MDKELSKDSTSLKNTEHSEESLPVPTVDLKQYRTSDLADRITELISVPEAFRKIILTAICFVLFALCAVYLVIHFSGWGLLPGLISFAYTFAAGIALGILLGIVRVVFIGMQNIELILNLILQITEKAAVDYEEVQTGTMKMPSGNQLVGQVYDDVVIPVVEKSISRGFGFLGTPVLWLYRRTLGYAAGYLIRKIKVIEVASGFATSGLGVIGGYSTSIKSLASRASEIVSLVGRRIRFVAMLPLCGLFLFALAIFVLPFLVIRFLF